MTPQRPELKVLAPPTQKEDPFERLDRIVGQFRREYLGERPHLTLVCEDAEDDHAALEVEPGVATQ